MRQVLKKIFLSAYLSILWDNQNKNKESNMHDPWVAYVVVGTVVTCMMIGKKMMFFSDDSKKKDKKDD